ncbi:hypothetical protein PsorP6_017750 [Peronosclerospora sorghi]|uniref:Uncharacterized protein n=1 Tax=Peronosclerospora sorghi TaxID=230839 RepID=A0ACC0WNP7_9STRA|nr:hypothetical protein PsorP6_017750 [Peronosclerospora sorghi]
MNLPCRRIFEFITFSHVAAQALPKKMVDVGNKPIKCSPPTARKDSRFKQSSDTVSAMARKSTRYIGWVNQYVGASRPLKADSRSHRRLLELQEEKSSIEGRLCDAVSVKLQPSSDFIEQKAENHLILV